MEEQHYTDVLAALTTVQARVVGKRLNVRFVMGDADKAQFNGVKNVFGGGAEYTYLMSFYPVVAKVRLA
ncbi:hypothetical protein L917_07258 [Phytophthora nicotianae]|uniref:Uncharacterized protein n=1 Tax=Phytophthora nicotianae TaxID=4792 RepID=W2LDR1_PHYNI|nr:hypothetical protein L917_07258 [Phytophthora nicotianae]